MEAVGAIAAEARGITRTNYKIEETGGKISSTGGKRNNAAPIAAGRVSKNEAGFTILIAREKKMAGNKEAGSTREGKRKMDTPRITATATMEITGVIGVEMEVFSIIV